MKPRIRFIRERIYHYRGRKASQKSNSMITTRFPYLTPLVNDNGVFGIVDCVAVNAKGEPNPDYLPYGEPVDIASIGKEFFDPDVYPVYQN